MIYLQSTSDTHLRDHCIPYLRAQGYAAHSAGIWYRGPEHIVWTADFAPGHTPLSRDQLISLLKRFTTTRFGVLSEVLELDGTPGYADDPQLRPTELVLARELPA